MTYFSSNLKGNGMMDLRISENVHHEMGDNQMGLELWAGAGLKFTGASRQGEGAKLTR